jgi:hypothetical protein
LAELKPGHVNDFTNSMAEAIENALGSEYLLANGVVMPGGGESDRKLLFAAIAQGVLGYLKANQDAFISTITLQAAGITAESTVTNLDLNIDTS